MVSSPAELLERARQAAVGSPEWILYSAAAFDALVDHPMILFGGGAQAVHTEQGRPDRPSTSM